MSELLYQYDVTASIVAYKTNPVELEQAIRNFLDCSLRIKIVIVDNSPTETLGPLCRALGAEYLFTGKNLGFGAAHNIAFVQLSTSKYHLVLNPDVQFGHKVLEELVAFLEMNESVGLVMPRVVYPNGSPQILCKRLPTPLDIIARRLFPGSLQRPFRSRMSAFELRDMDMSKVLSVPYLSGCFMLLRRKCLQEVGLFDERFFMYFEDLDLTRRINMRFNTVYYPRTTIIHRHEKGSYKSVWLLFCGIQSAVRYFNKWGWMWDRDRLRINETIGPLEDICLPIHE
jgi:GT2 family glycosyltransferase